MLLTPGSYYHPWQGKDKVSTSGRGAEQGVTQFRFSFAFPTVSSQLRIFNTVVQLADSKAEGGNGTGNRKVCKSSPKVLGSVVRYDISSFSFVLNFRNDSYGQLLQASKPYLDL